MYRVFFYSSDDFSLGTSKADVFRKPYELYEIEITEEEYKEVSDNKKDYIFNIKTKKFEKKEN